MGKKNNEKYIVASYNKILFGFCLVILIAAGFLDLRASYFLLYCFGLLFFAAGLFAVIFIKYFGIVFLFSHGIVGIGMMIAPALGNYLKQPVLSDLSTGAYIYIGLIFTLILIAFIMFIIVNLIDKLKSHKDIYTYPLIILSIAIFLAKLLPRIIGTISRINF